jgi:hypothetical protein
VGEEASRENAVEVDRLYYYILVSLRAATIFSAASKPLGEAVRFHPVPCFSSAFPPRLGGEIAVAPCLDFFITFRAECHSALTG